MVMTPAFSESPRARACPAGSRRGSGSVPTRACWAAIGDLVVQKDGRYLVDDRPARLALTGGAVAASSMGWRAWASSSSTFVLLKWPKLSGDLDWNKGKRKRSGSGC